MKRSAAVLLSVLLLSAFLLSSCGSSKLTDPYLLEIPEKNILGMTVDQIKTADPNTADNSMHPMEKDLEDGRHRLKYVINGDAFVDGGAWITTVYYYFTDGVLSSYQIEYRQSNYSEGMCANRMSMFKEYLNEKFGDGTEAKVILGEYAVLGTAWQICGATLDMSRQNGGWILFTYHK